MQSTTEWSGGYSRPYNDMSNWSAGVPVNYSGITAGLGNGSSSVPGFLDGYTLWLHDGGTLVAAQVNALGSGMHVVSGPSDNAGPQSGEVLLAGGTLYNSGEIGAGVASTMTVFDHSGTLVNHGTLDAIGKGATLNFYAHNQYPGFSGTLENDGTISVNFGSAVIDAMLKGSGVITINDGGSVDLKGPDSGGTIQINDGMLELSPKSTFIYAPNDPATSIAATIDISQQGMIQLDNRTGTSFTIDQSVKPGISEMAVLNASGSVIAKLDFDGSYGAGSFAMASSGQNTVITLAKTA